MSFFINYKNNLYVLDGLTLTTVWLERIIVEDGEIIYTEDYLSLPLGFCLKELTQDLSGAWKKEEEKNLDRFP